MSGPLSHVRVLDLSRILAGPWAGQTLADLGADVIKVERPKVGDDTRSWGPPFLKKKNGEQTNMSAYYLCANRGKRSIEVDLSTNEGQKVIRELVAHSDILLENYKVGTLTKYGLGYSDLKTINPKLIYCSITGFGQSGPRKDQAAYDFMIQAMSGLMSITGERDRLPGGGPQKVGTPIVDLMTGMYASNAVLAALAKRNETGKGDYIDIAMLDVMVNSLANRGMNYLVSNKTPQRAGNQHPNIQPQDVFKCRDGHIAIVVGNDNQYTKFCTIIGLPELATDQRFFNNSSRVKYVDILLPIIQKVMLQKDVQEWTDKFEKASIPCGPINTIENIFNDPQVKHRDILFQVQHTDLGQIPQLKIPIRFQNSSFLNNKPPPQLGQHTEEILAEIKQLNQIKNND
ncbi:CaiB/BaiF CoA transferase family protein [Aliikangiella sp. IMCC44359]|uniref:CaiB/BaiF CoA transferase family protein n=1 Tax=Aliikangiella sp. IMCC44359 TaxID=3459125 RepID=UPI00403AB62A